MNNNKTPLTGSLSRREFIQTSAVVTGAAAIAGSIALPFSVHAAASEHAPTAAEESIKYSACLVNCGSRCPLKVHVKNGEIIKIANEAIYDDSTFGLHQIRPCLRGRSVRWKPIIRIGLNIQCYEWVNAVKVNSSVSVGMKPQLSLRII